MFLELVLYYFNFRKEINVKLDFTSLFDTLTKLIHEPFVEVSVNQALHSLLVSSLSIKQCLEESNLFDVNLRSHS